MPLLLVAGFARASADDERRIAASQRLKARIDALDEQDEYLAELSLAIERLKLSIPPTKQNEDEFFDAFLDVTSLASYVGHASLADELSRILLSVAKSRLSPDDIQLASVWREYASNAHTFRGRDESWRAQEEARCILESTGAMETEQYAGLLWGRGNWYRWKDNAASLEYLRASLDLEESLKTEPGGTIADKCTWVGWMCLHLGRHDEARTYLQRARDLLAAEGRAGGKSYGIVLNAQGDLHAIAGDWAASEGCYREATQIGEVVWRKIATTRSVPISGYNLMAFAQAKQGKFDDAWRSLQRCRMGQGARAAVGIASWRVRNDPDYDAIQSMYDQLLLDRATARALEEAPAIAAETWQALVNQLDLATRCARAESDYAIKRPIPEASLARLQSQIGDDTAYMGWLDAKFADQLSASTGPFLNARWLYVVRHSGPIQWMPIYEATTREDVKARRAPAFDFYTLMKRASSWRERLEDDPELVALAKRVYPSVFGQNQFELKGVSKLIAEYACYDEWIQTENLIAPDGRYVADRYSISFSPSAAVYVALAESPRRARRYSEPAVLAIGDPVFSASERTTDISRLDEVNLRAAVNHDRSSLDRLPRLPYSGRELDRVRELFSSCTVLRGNGATEAAINGMVSNDKLVDFDIVHVATHALVDPAPERCAIALSRQALDETSSNDGLIDTSEIRMGWKLDAELVTLSACQTAGLSYSRGEPVGFAQALFQAGARCVLVSFWKVDDEATSLLMSRFYENVAAGNGEGKHVSFSTALSDAKSWLRNYRDPAGKRPFAHPVYWSGFMLIGDAD